MAPFEYFKEIRKNYTQIVSFVSGAIALVVAAVLTSKMSTRTQGTSLLCVAAVLLPIIAMHYKAFSPTSITLPHRRQLHLPIHGLWIGVKESIVDFSKLE